MAPVTYRSGKLNPLLASIPPKIREIDFSDCLASNPGWTGAGGRSGGESGHFRARDPLGAPSPLAPHPPSRPAAAASVHALTHPAHFDSMTVKSRQQWDDRQTMTITTPGLQIKPLELLVRCWGGRARVQASSRPCENDVHL